MSGLLEQRQAIHLKLKENQRRIDQLEEQIQATQKLASLGTMACLAAHEFNNILMPMINYAELALKHDDDMELMRKALEKVIYHGNHAARIINSMLGVMRIESSQKEKVLLRQLVEECFQSLARDFQKDNITVQLEIASDLTIHVVPGQFQQVLLNLIINARQALLRQGGVLRISAGISDDKNVKIEISDTGCGIAPEHMDRIFEPFFSTKRKARQVDQQGTGLGLSICRDIIQAHQGSISASSQPGRGTTFTILLPCCV